MKKHVLIICFSFFINSLFSQENKQELVWFDNIIHQKNLPIDQGIIYAEKYRTFNRNHHFLFDNAFLKGNLKYNNQMYYNVSMKYDTYDDNLILKINSKTEIFSIILNKELTSFFQINGRTFYNINSSGFYEILYKSKNETLVKKHFSKKETLEKEFVYSNFTHEEKLFIFKDNKFHTMSNEKDFHEIFPTKKKVITDFFEMNKRKNIEDNAGFILNLIKKLNNE